MKYRILSTLILLVSSFSQKCPADKPQTLLTFHPHMDAFWLNTEDELTNISFKPAPFLYQMDQRNSKQIFNSMYEALSDATTLTDRRYLITEVYFLKDWYDSLDSTKKRQIKEWLVTGKLEVTNMAWVENDQAVCYYDDIIEQYTVGMNWLHSTFGYVGRWGWATDSFGHSQSMAALQNELGIEIQATERLDDRFTYRSGGSPPLQFYWHAKSYSNNLTYDGLMTHCRWFPHEPAGYLGRDQPSQVASQMREISKLMKDLYKKPTMFRFFGNDFEQFTRNKFKTLQDTMDILNRQAGCEQFKYGNPSEYAEKLQEHFKSNKLQSRDYDMMPNYDYGNYWTGYYTTDPALKKICKDYSRLVNVYKKIIVKKLKDDKSLLSSRLSSVTKAQELLALMQHHDGITATSKHHVEVGLQKKMQASENEMIEDIKKLQGLSEHVECNLLHSNYLCELPENIGTKFSLTLVNSGSLRRKRVEIKLPKDKHYVPDSDHMWELFCFDESTFSNCTMIYELLLPPGQTKLVFSAANKETIRQYTVFPQQVKEGTFQNAKFTIENENEFVYEYGGEKIKVSYVMSSGQGNHKSATNYTKFGRPFNISIFVPSGFYIMSNDGKLSSYGGKITRTKVLLGTNTTKIELTFQENIRAIITIDKSQPFALDIITNFQPKQHILMDYFIKVWSSINGGKDFYHDSNGYLVMKRTESWRPDYKIVDAPIDKINGNTYPSTSFAYRTDGKKKLVVSLDRAEGVALYEQNTLLLNIDRLTSDDKKGADEAYPYVVKNTFRHRVAITDLRDSWERRCQKDLDQAILGFVRNTTQKQTASPVEIQGNLKVTEYLKYTTAILNNHTVLVRVQNLAEHQNLSLTLLDNQNVALHHFGLSIPFKDIKEAFHSGIPIGPRYRWLENESPSNVDIHKNKFESSEVILRPLQIRSFRVDLQSYIQVGGEPFKVRKSSAKTLQTLQLRRLFKKVSTSPRCF